MEQVKLKHLTENSWLVLSGDGMDRVGLLAEQRDNFLLLANNVKRYFTSKEEIIKYFDKDVFSDAEGAVAEEEADYFVNGFPVDINPVEVTIDGCELAVYKKRESSTIIYVAGYFCLSYSTGWIGSRCPKFSTLEKRKYKGPFKTEKEMKFVLSRARKE